MSRKMNIKRLSMRFSDGGAQPEPTPATNPEPVPQPTAQPVQTQPQAVNVDINAIISQAETKASEAAERKMEAVFKSMLQQQGFDSDAIASMTAEWKSKQQTPESIIQAKEADIAARDTTITTLQQQIEAERQEKIALAKGVPLGTEDEEVKKKVDACLLLARSNTTAEMPFETALEKALEIISFKQPDPADTIPRFAGGSPSPIKTSMTKDEFMKLSYMEQYEYKQKYPEKYKQIFGG